MLKLQAYSKSFAEIPLRTRTERRLRQKQSLLDKPKKEQMKRILKEIDQEYGKIVEHPDFLKVSEKSVIGGFNRNDILQFFAQFKALC